VFFINILKVFSLAGIEGNIEKAWPYILNLNATKCDPPFDTEIETGPDSAKRKALEALKVWTPR